MLFRTVQILYANDWKSIKNGSEITLEDSMEYSYQDNSKLRKSNPGSGQKFPIRYKSLKIIRAHYQFGFRPIIITLYSWDSKIRYFQFIIF